MVDSFVQQGFSAIAYRDADGKVAAQGGRFVESPALAAELARIREHELGLEAEPSRDAEVAERVLGWFEAA